MFVENLRIEFVDFSRPTASDGDFFYSLDFAGVLIVECKYGSCKSDKSSAADLYNLRH